MLENLLAAGVAPAASAFARRRSRSVELREHVSLNSSPTWFRPTKIWLTARHDPVSSPGNVAEMVAATESHRILALFRGTLFCMSYAADK